MDEPTKRIIKADGAEPADLGLAQTSCTAIYDDVIYEGVR
jgi:hypothetical protein